MSKKDGILLVEGDDDQHVVWALCEYHQVAETFEVLKPSQRKAKADGIEALLTLFETQIKSDVRVLGIVVDADLDFDGRWQSIKRIIERAQKGHSVPATIPAEGLIIDSVDPAAPRIGVWMMPDNQARGALEDFVRYLIPAENPLVPYAENVLNEIETAGIAPYTPKRSKAFIHTWLAWQNSPGRPMGLAITQKALAADSPTAHIFVAWLGRLYN